MQEKPWLLITLTNGEVFVAREHKEDALSVVVTDVLHCSYGDYLGLYVVNVARKMRFINRSAILYRDVIDELVEFPKQYEDTEEIPWYFQRYLLIGGLG